MSGGITEADLKRGIRTWANRLHVPVTRMMSRVLREEIEAARADRVAREKPEREAFARKMDELCGPRAYHRLNGGGQ